MTTLKPTFLYKIHIFLVLLFVIAPQFAHAQRYANTLGVRIGNNRLGLTFQQLIGNHSTIEAIAHTNVVRDITLTALYQYHRPILVRSLNWYTGGGAHIGSHSTEGTFYGIDGIAGLEWKLPILRFNVSVDTKPALHFGRTDKNIEWQHAISVRYVLTTYREMKRKERLKEREKKKQERLNNNNPFDNLPYIFDKKEKDNKKNDKDPKTKSIFDIFKKE